MSHSHSTHDTSNRNLLIATLLNVLITTVEIIGGIMANSLALLSDAAHNLGDTIALLLAYIARRISSRTSNERMTFGYKRAEILAAFINAFVLIGISAFLVVEAVKRFSEPEPIKGLLMLIVASAGLVFNLAAMLLLKKHSGDSLNIKSAYLHLLGDTLSSVAVIIGGILIYFFEIVWVDPLITILISVYISRETWSVLKQATDILMQSTPAGMDIQFITKELAAIDGISNIHHVHVWSLGDKDFHFECHVDMEKDLEVSKTAMIRSRIEQILHDKFDIGHVTVQFEFDECDDKDVIHKNNS
ncbi:MAG: cation transporter [Bacteroidetes bacterium]|nr:cation transporter [Bacteroidota bacterium]